jgi:hypothetical protein
MKDKNNLNRKNKFTKEVSNAPVLLAPNGKPSNLNPEQYKLVRSNFFKFFFGEWEKLALAKINDSGIDDVSLKRLEDGVSKIVDENGEPLVCYHGTFNDEFTIFRNSDIGAHFGTYEQAKRRVNSDKAFIKPFFLNIKNPLMLLDFDKGKWDGVAVGLMLRDSNILPMYIRIEIEEILEINEAKNGLSASKRQDNRMRELLESINYDGIIYNNEFEGEGRSFITFKPNQIKIANGKNTTFDFNNPDFTLAGGGSIGESETFYERTYADGTKTRFSVEEYEQNIYPDIRFAGGGFVSFKDKYNKKFGYPTSTSHNLKQISKDTRVSLKGLQQIYNKGIGAFKTNPSSVRPTVKSKEQWAMARVYSAVMGGKASKIDSNELKMKNGGGIPDNYIHVVNNFGSGETLNKVFNEWSNIQSEKDQANWSMRVKLLRFGTYGQYDLLYVMEKFDFDKSDKINGILKRDFKKEVESAYDNEIITINKNNEMKKESETFGGGGGVTIKSSHTLNSNKGKIAISLDKKWSDIDILLVPISFLVKCSEFNRRNYPKYSLDDSAKNIENIKKSFIENGITEPLILSYIKNESKLLLLEGNHRLNALIELEVPYYPVCVTTIDSWAKGKGKGVKTKIKPYFVTEIGKSRYTSVDNFEGVPYVNIENNHVDVNETDTLTINVPLLIRLFEYIREDVDNDAQIHFLTENLLKLKDKPELSMIDYDSIIDGIKIKKTAEKILALGGLAEGPPHSKGGIPLVVKSTGQNIEIEGGELVVNKFSSSETEKFEFEGKDLTPCEIVSELNSMDNNGVEIDCNKIVGRFKK